MMSATPKDAAWSQLEGYAASWGVPLSSQQRAAIMDYIERLLAYGAKTNLTAESDPSAILLRHVADGLAAAGALKRLLIEVPRPRILDLGAGGGFIGMAIKIGWPEADVTLMESRERKYRFLNAASAASGLKGLHVLLRRAGAGAADPRGSGFDAVTARALASLPESLALALPLVRKGGCFLSFQSRLPDPSEPSLNKALASHGGRLIESIPYRLPAEEQQRFLSAFIHE